MTPAPETSKKPRRLTPLILLAVILVWLGFRLLLPHSPTPLAGTRPDNLGVTAGKFAPCPSSPNCVSSQSATAEHFIEPLSYEGSPREAMNKLEKIILNQPRTQITFREENYFSAEFTSQWMGFVDDGQFLVNPKENVIEVRSASRLGESDLEANRKRIETSRSLFNQS